MAFHAASGTADLLPERAHDFHLIERAAQQVFGLYGYQQIATPAFEQTDVFVRGIGQATDVVGKEMYYVFSQDAATKLVEKTALKADQRLALRPEGTAGVVRAAVQHNLVPPGAAPARLWYAGPMFRHERQQKGRYRQFHQIGVEFLGAAEASADAEVVLMLMRFFVACGIPAEAMRLYLNSMGDDDCRPAYRAQVRNYILAHSGTLCPECQRRADTNPLRAFDCKNPDCAAVMADAPRITDALCPSCAEHYAQVKALLVTEGLAFEENPRLVRGLDYYTRTVFEVQVDAGLGAQNAIGGGGRYDKLMEEFGGKPTPGLGFAVGLERIVLVLDELRVARGVPPATEVFVAGVVGAAASGTASVAGAAGAGATAASSTAAASAQDTKLRATVFSTAEALRVAGIRTQLDHQGRSLKSQLKLADKLGVCHCVIIGPEELAVGEVVLRNMQSHAERRVPLQKLPEILVEELRSG
ncbi:MAG: histidine--tRNA ligase [Coriobacteriales bacterium]|jgi:histidyl-tRNA synthetase|nr:histidine--tRNA ligase [Coriobacteriales bacterium]